MTTNADGPFCGANRRGGEGGKCRRPAGWGTDHLGFGQCKLHGGSTPTHVKHANGQKAAAAVVTFGLPREVDPQTALLEEVHRTAGHVEWLAQKLRDGDDSDLTQTTFGGGKEPSVWVKLHQQERSHLVKVTTACIGAGIAERQVRIAEQMGQQLAGTIRDVLDDFAAALIAKGAPADVLQSVVRELLPGIVRRRLSAIVEVSS